MKLKKCHKYIYKIHSRQLKKNNWNLTLPLKTAMKEYPDIIVSLNDSQILRFIDEINGTTDIDEKSHEIKRKIKLEKKKPKSRTTRMFIRELYDNLYNLQFQKDYICVIMDSDSDYDRANQGFSVNGITYKRFLGTNGGIKNSTIVYVNEQLYPELKKRLDNGRNMNKELVPAKLEAYQALICSGSTPIPYPNGIIVVDDCITHFKDNVILIDDESDGEPLLNYINDYEIEHNNSDGYGLMLPSYARKVNQELNGEDDIISGFNARYAWTKGMIYTFDFVDFAEKVAGTYEIVDAWGHKQDVRNAEVILTVSMLKLYDSYDSWEHFYENCENNHYQFCAAKTTPNELENVRNTNYQFLQSYDFTDEELQELCQPTIDEITGVLGLDYRKSLAFLAGFGLNENNVIKDNFDSYIKALMIDRRMINDPFVRRKIYNMIKKRIEMAKRGAIKIDANFAMISGDPYALAQSMFGLEITGLLKSGEVYHKYWIDKGSTEIACFRAPMTCHNNITKLKLRNDAETSYWYQYIKTAIILNAFDSTCEAMNGSDFDGDTNMDTDNKIILNKTRKTPTIVCVQRKANKCIPTEEDIIKANKLAFNDDIGIVTNHVTSMFEVQANFEPQSDEYKMLAYRIMCGQHYQQAVIDRAKGIIAKPMPDYWYDKRKISDDEQKNLNELIVASKKPYFMIYIYPLLKKQYLSYVKNANRKARMLTKHSIDELYDKKDKTEQEKELLRYYELFMPVGTNDCVVNRICRIFENQFKDYKLTDCDDAFDYRIMKSNVGYSNKSYNDVLKIYAEYIRRVGDFQKRIRTEKVEKDNYNLERQKFIDIFKYECEEVCSNEDELCDIVLDICYTSEKSKQFAWDVCGQKIVENLLKLNNHKICYPEKTSGVGDFEYCGINFRMNTLGIGEMNDNT